MKYNVKKMRGNRLLITQQRTKQVGKILIASQDQEKQKEATVQMVGPDVEDISIGDKVLFTAFSDEVLDEDDGTIWSIITDDDVMAIIGDKECGKETLV